MTGVSVVAFVVLLTITFDGSDGQGVTVVQTFGMWNCKGYEDNTRGLNRPFRVVCSKTVVPPSPPGTKKGKKPKPVKVNLDCRYTGNPHPCAKYNKEQKRFYQELLDGVGRHIDQEGTCHPGGLKTKLCKDQIVYIKV